MNLTDRVKSYAGAGLLASTLSLSSGCSPGGGRPSINPISAAMWTIRAIDMIDKYSSQQQEEQNQTTKVPEQQSMQQPEPMPNQYFVCKSFKDEDKNGLLDLKTEVVGIDKDHFSSGEQVCFVAQIYDKPKLWNHLTFFLFDQSRSLVTRQDYQFLDSGYTTHAKFLCASSNTNSDLQLLSPGEYTANWNLNGKEFAKKHISVR